ncbi:MAG: hypothetical protein SGBAC_012886 [Bacillariaceae sp.]
MDDSSSNNPFDNPRPYDILCGRKRSSYNNIGNRRFRITISMNVEKYNSMRSRHERSKFIANLAQTMRYEVGFRFLKKKTQGKVGVGELSDDEIRAKIGHALRDLSTNMQQNRGDQAVESKVPRPGPYKKQDKKALRIVSSSSSLETMGTMSSAQSTLDGSGAQEEEETKKKKIKPDTVSAAPPITVQSALMANIQQQQQKLEACASPDLLRSFSDPSPLHLTPTLFQVAEEETTTPLKSNLDKSILTKKTIALDEQENNNNLRLYPLDVGEACKSLLNPPPLNLIPSLDEDDELFDDFWRTSELRNENSALAASAMSIGSGCDNLSLPSSCCLSDVMETLSLVSSS